MFPERTYTAFSLSAAAAESWSTLTPPSSLQNMDRAEDETPLLLILVSLLHKYRQTERGVHSLIANLWKTAKYCD